MSTLYKVPPAFAAAARLRLEDYRRMYAESIASPDAFWARQAGRLEWIRAPRRIKHTSYAPDDFHIRWYEDGRLNVAANCLDRHLASPGEETAITVDGDAPRV
jgi:acetyl-CoA synthetase